MSKIIVKVVGAREAAAKLRIMEYNMVSFGDAFDEIGEDFRMMVLAQFAAGAWAPLAPLTISKRGGSSKPLVFSGALQASWTIEGAAGNITTIGAQSAKFGSRHVALSNIGQVVATAAMHQSGRGGGHKSGPMPARPVKMLNAALEEIIVETIGDHIMQGV